MDEQQFHPQHLNDVEKMKNEKKDIKVISKTYRYKFSEHINNLLLDFGQQHKFDSKNDFKENWDIWTSEYHEDINNEDERLKELGYTGNIINKMYKSVRYYYCKKHTTTNGKQNKRRKYISKNPDFIEFIDNFIKRQFVYENSTSEENNDGYAIYDLKPSKGWEMFNEMFKEEIKQEIERILQENSSISESSALQKIKKTFNNRYFINVKSL
jgi:hypothetical protein